MGHREFWRGAEPAPSGVEAAAQRFAGVLYEFLARFSVLRMLHADHRCGDLFAGLEKAAAAFLPKPGYLLKQLDQPDLPAAAVLREIRPGEKRLLIRRHKNGHRPAARAVDRLTGSHIHGVDVRALLPVNFDADIVIV